MDPLQPGLLSTPPREPHRVGRLGLGHLHRHLEQGRAAGSVVVDAGTRGHAVHVAAGHHHVGRVAPSRLGDDVLGGPDLGDDLGGDPDGGARRSGERLAGREGQGHRGEIHGLTKCPGEQVGAIGVGDRVAVALVEHDRADRAGSLRVGHLVPECARAPLQQGDLAVDDAAGARVEVGGFAAARRRPRRGQVDVHRNDIAPTRRPVCVPPRRPPDSSIRL